MADINRIKKELRDCSKDPDTSGLKVELVDEANLLHWKGSIKGPVGTPYEGGLFKIDIQLPSDYPFVPPKMKYDTKIWHPNISSESGAICLDILKNEWSPALTVRTALISLQALMSAPEPDDPRDAVVAKQYKESNQDFVNTAKFWTETYAAENKEPGLDMLKDMGFEEDKARAALKSCGGNVDAAMEMLLAEA